MNVHCDTFLLLGRPLHGPSASFPIEHKCPGLHSSIGMHDTSVVMIADQEDVVTFDVDSLPVPLGKPSCVDTKTKPKRHSSTSTRSKTPGDQIEHGSSAQGGDALHLAIFNC